MKPTPSPASSDKKNSSGGWIPSFSRFMPSSSSSTERTVEKQDQESKESLSDLKKRHKKELQEAWEQRDTDLDMANRRNQENMRQKENEVTKLKTEIHGKYARISRLERGLRDWEAAYNRERESASKSLNEAKQAQKKALAEANWAKGELEEERKHVRVLQQSIQDQEQTVAKAHSTAISLLARDVSSDFPDDEIRGRFREFVEGDLNDWCVEYRKRGKIAHPERAELDLREKRLLRPDNGFLPDHLQFDMTNSAAPVILLSAGLAHDLCRKLLQNPLFLAPEPWLGSTQGAGSTAAFSRQTLLEVISALPEEKTIDWRARTCELLEQVTSPNKLAMLFGAMAKDFTDTYHYLHEPLDDTGAGELARLYQEFGRFALRLARRRASIEVQGLNHRTLDQFQVMHGAMDAHSAVKLLARDTSLDKRPVCVVTWPRIVSTPVGGQVGSGGGGSASRPQNKPIVWTNAIVWVSNKPSPGDAVALSEETRPMDID